jgi:cysteine-rich repeat protein
MSPRSISCRQVRRALALAATVAPSLFGALSGALFGALVGASCCEAQAMLIDGLGGPAGFGTDTVPVGDDMSATITVDVTPAFPMGLDFFGTNYRQIHVNTNGNITFESRFGTFTPTAFPGAPQPLIAPWWGDGDTRGVVAEPPGANRIYYVVEPGRVVVTWFLLGYFGSHTDLLNSFQLILTPPATPMPGDSPGSFDVEIRYQRCEWTTGDASGGSMGLGGTPAQAGLDAGDDVNFVTLPGSLTMRVLELCTTSNVGEPGVWRLSPRGTAIVATCGNGFRESGETCDDGNVLPGDGCDASCRVEAPPECGDGRMDPGEECDDGNRASRDGCDRDCFLELGPCDPLPATRDASMRPDVGGTCTDAGPPDAGNDAGRDAGPDVPVLEGGGCACRARRGGGGWGGVGLLALAWAVRRARRRR